MWFRGFAGILLILKPLDKIRLIYITLIFWGLLLTTISEYYLSRLSADLIRKTGYINWLSLGFQGPVSFISGFAQQF